jgi:CspA family cold shock protein
MKTGIVKFFNIKNRFGFIIDDETKKEYYVHAKDVEGVIQEGNKVTFDLKEEKRGLACVQVKKKEV